MTGDLRGVNDDGFRTILGELITDRQTLQRAHIPMHEIRENVLTNVTGRNLAENYIALLDQDGFWGGEVELGAAAEILQVRIIVHRGNREVPINPANNEGTFLDVHLRFNGGHYDVLIRNPAYIEPVVDLDIVAAGGAGGSKDGVEEEGVTTGGAAAASASATSTPSVAPKLSETPLPSPEVVVEIETEEVEVSDILATDFPGFGDIGMAALIGSAGLVVNQAIDNDVS